MHVMQLLNNMKVNLKLFVPNLEICSNIKNICSIEVQSNLQIYNSKYEGFAIVSKP